MEDNEVLMEDGLRDVENIYTKQLNSFITLRKIRIQRKPKTQIKAPKH